MIRRKTLMTEKATLTLKELVDNTGKVLDTILDRGSYTPGRMGSLKKIPYIGTNSILFTTNAGSDTNKHDYKTVIAFYEVKNPESDIPGYNSSPVRVSCGCSAYYFWFSYFNYINGAQYGTKPKTYVPVKPPSGRPPLNPQKLPGLCKHLIRFARELSSAGYID